MKSLSGIVVALAAAAFIPGGCASQSERQERACKGSQYPGLWDAARIVHEKGYLLLGCEDKRTDGYNVIIPSGEEECIVACVRALYNGGVIERVGLERGILDEKLFAAIGIESYCLDDPKLFDDAVRWTQIISAAYTYDIHGRSEARESLERALAAEGMRPREKALGIGWLTFFDGLKNVAEEVIVTRRAEHFMSVGKPASAYVVGWQIAAYIMKKSSMSTVLVNTGKTKLEQRQLMRTYETVR